MKVTILSIFPKMIQGAVEHSIVKRAIDGGLLDIEVIDIRDFSKDKHRTVDDYQYGGGAGMVMKPEPVFAAAGYVKDKNPEGVRFILTSPEGEQFNQAKAFELSREEKRIAIICGHYEGFDNRIILGIEPEEISLGDFVMTGGELAALVIVDAACRLIPGVLGNETSLDCESFGDYLLDYPKYTRPAVFQGMEVPPVLLNGNHAEIEKWRREMAEFNTKRKRPDLYEKYIKAKKKGAV